MNKSVKLFLYTLAFALIPVIAIAAPAEAVAATEAVPWQAQVAKYLSAGGALAVSAVMAGYAQAKIGAAGAGTLAERPEAGTTIIVLQALPEIIVLLGFVGALILAG
jgi:V/A-type H+-transporting ATPase subunit K